MKPHWGPCARVAGTTLVALAASLSTSDVGAKQWFVQSGGAQVAFSPQFLTVQAGDTVTFLNLGGNHNVVADDGSFRCAHGCDGDGQGGSCLLYTSDAADERSSVDLGGRRIIK